MPRTKKLEKTSESTKDITKTRQARKSKSQGLRIDRIFSKRGDNPLDSVEYETRSCKIINPDGSVVFEMDGIEIPKTWSKVASDILISKYIRKNGVPQYDNFGNLIKNKNGEPIIGPEKSVKQVISRMASCWRWWGEKYRYFASSSDAQAFEDEIKFMLVNQYGAPNSPQWFNTGLAHSYNITGPAQGHWYADPKTAELKLSEDAYTRPQPHACFIQSVRDDLVNEGGIFDLITREARIFKYGSGSGANFSALRGDGEPLSGGGKSSGLMSWLQIFDKAAGSIKSGGTTRRASKMVVLNIDHPDVETFVEWKLHEEQKAAALIAAGYAEGIDGEAYQTISGQNSNNSIRVSDDFMKAVIDDGEWHLRWRTDMDHISKTVKAQELWGKIANSTWHCGDPGIQFDTTINDWHTCLASGRINASNPCSEFMFIDNSSCNLASMNLVKFLDETTGEIDIAKYSHAARLWTIVLEISVLMAQFPSNEIAKNSYLFRPLGLGYANLGALLMIMGLAYDSDQGRAIAGALTAIMTGEAYATSAEMAKFLGTFKEYDRNKDDMLRVIRNHRRAIYNAPQAEYEGLNKIPVEISEQECPDYLLSAARESWDKALLSGGQYGFRNAQVTLLAPTGTIGLAMDCDTTGIEPDYALVKFKKLAGGGYFKIVNQAVPQALKNLGYTAEQVKKIIAHIIGSATLEDSPHINRQSLIQKGFDENDLKQIEKKLLGSFDMHQVFSSDVISADTIKKLGISPEKSSEQGFDLLSELGFSPEQIAQANSIICGLMTIEGAPQLKDEHLPIFDCANRCGQSGKRFISPLGHINMMAAAQPFLSGAISKTVNIPSEATVEDVGNIYMESWKKSLKAVAIYRDGSKMTQPLNTKSSSGEKADNEVEVRTETVIEYRPTRKRLPKERTSITRKVTIGGHKMYLTVGLYDDKKPGELFIVMNKQGSFAAGMADSFAKMVSIGLQYGVPIETIVTQLRHMRYQPMGYTGDSDISNASSITDFIAQWLKKLFLEQEVKAIKLPLDETKDEPTQTVAPIGDAGSLEKENGNYGSGNSSARGVFKEELGFSGETCPECGSASMVQNGKCLKCVNCGTTTGCS